VSDFVIKEGDRDPAIEATLRRDGSPYDLSDARRVDVVIGTLRDPPVVDAQATITDAANGTVRYIWQFGDTDEPGTYRTEWVVTTLSGAETTFPDDGYKTVTIQPEVNRR
jgi:hypothetical protein